MKVMVFLHGTATMHRSAVGKSREERVRQSREREEGVLDYKTYVPVGDAVRKIKSWEDNGAQIVYLSSHKGKKEERDVENDKRVLEKYGFPAGPVYFRGRSEQYKDVVERVLPDVLVEDDCESIGGEPEMTYPRIRPDLKSKIKSIVVKEFSGIDHLPDNPQELLTYKD